MEKVGLEPTSRTFRAATPLISEALPLCYFSNCYKRGEGKDWLLSETQLRTQARLPTPTRISRALSISSPLEHYNNIIDLKKSQQWYLDV